MIDYTAGEEKKKIGCLRAFLILLLVLGLVAGAVYLFLPKIISSAMTGGAASVILPQEIRRGTEDFKLFLDENIGQLEKIGLSPREASDIVSSLEYGTVETIVSEIESSSVSNTSQLIDIVSKHVDLSAADLDQIKNEYYTEFPAENLQQALTRFKTNPLIMKSGFRLVKETILNVLENQDVLTESVTQAAEESSEETTTESSGNKKKK